MALTSATIFEVRTAGDDTNNSGAFDPSRTAGMFTDGAATSATGNSPVFSSASYNFVAGDVGAKVFIGAGTNWTRGWYEIASVAANNATLKAAIGEAIQSLNENSPTGTLAQLGVNTVAGCATTASPTGATWTIDYSQQNAAQFTYTDLASAGAGLTVSSVAKPFAKQQVGNSLVITGGTNFTAGRYVISSISGVTATVVGPGNITTGVGASGTGAQGGALASPGQAGAHMVSNNSLFLKTGTYTIASASQNIATGCWAPSGSAVMLCGYDTLRGDLIPVNASGTRPTLVASGISTFTLCAPSGGLGNTVACVILDGASLTSSRGVSGNGTIVYKVKGQNFTNNFVSNSSLTTILCSATGCTTAAVFANTGQCFGCVAYSNTITGFSGAAVFVDCLSYSNSGASSDGFAMSTQAGMIINCTAYSNGRDGIRHSGNAAVVANCIAESNTGGGINVDGFGGIILNCAGFSNTGGNVLRAASVHPFTIGFITGSSSFFTNAAGADFSLNSTANAGALLRGTGYPGILPIGGTGAADIGALQHSSANTLFGLSAGFGLGLVGGR